MDFKVSRCSFKYNSEKKNGVLALIALLLLFFECKDNTDKKSLINHKKKFELQSFRNIRKSFNKNNIYINFNDATNIFLNIMQYI